MNKNLKYLLIPLLLILYLSNVSAVVITESANNPVNNSVVNLKTSPLSYNLSVVNANLNNISWSWNGASTVLYDNSCMFRYNLNNNSAIGENETVLKDLCPKGANATVLVRSTGGYANYSEGYYKNGMFFNGSNRTADTNGAITVTSPSTIINMTGLTNFTYSVFVKLGTNSTSTDAYSILRFQAGGQAQWLNIESAGTVISYVDTTNASSYKRWECSFTGHIRNTWNHLAVVWTNETGIKVYKNGINVCNDTSYNGNLSLRNSYFNGTITNIRIGTGYDFNGTLDEPALFNRTFSPEEIQTLYQSNIEKVNSTMYNFLYNNTNLTNKQTYNYSMFVNDSLNSFAYINLSKFTTAFGSIISVTTNEIGKVNKYFFGINYHFDTWFTGGKRIDFNGDGTSDTDSNTTLQLNLLRQSGINYLRGDMDLGSFYGGIANLDIEDWKINNTCWQGSPSPSLAIDWVSQSFGGARGCINRTSDAISGTSAYFINNTNSTGNSTQYINVYYANSQPLPLQANTGYNISFWMKGNASVNAHLQDMDSFTHSIGYQTFTANATWREFKVNGSSTYNSTNGWRFVVDDINAGEYIIIDNLSITQNGNSLPSWWRIGNDSGIKRQFVLAHDNDFKLLAIDSYMPEFLADINSGCNVSASTNDCAPKNYTIFAEISLDWINRMTLNGTYSDYLEVEFWNEPYFRFDDIYGYDNNLQTISYNLMYNATYDLLKASYPNLPIYAPSVFYYEATPNITNAFFSNFSNKSQGYSFHPYVSTSYMTGDSVNRTITNMLMNMTNRCNFYSSNCSTKVLSEWGVANKLLTNTTSRENEWYLNFAYAYAQLINYDPTTTRSMPYQWGYTSPENYSSHPDSGIIYEFVNEASNSINPPFYVTANMSTYASKLSSIYTSSSSNGFNILPIVSKINDTCSIPIINAESGGDFRVNITINTTGFKQIGCKNIWADSVTGELYDGNGDTATFGDVNNSDMGIPARYITNPILNLSNSGLSKYNYLNELIGIGQEINISAEAENDAGKTIHIASSIQANVTLILEAECSRISKIELTPKDGALYNPAYSCAGNTLVIPNARLNASATSNQVVIYYGAVETVCTGFFGAGDTFVSFIAVIVAIVMAGIVIMFLMGSDTEIDMTTLTIGLIVGAIVMIFGAVIINNIGNGC